MKKTINIITSIILAVALVGCVTPQSSQTNVALEQAIVTGAVADGTVLVLEKDPQYRPDFVLGEAVLVSLASNTNLTLTPAQIDAALGASNLTNPVVNVLIDNAVLTLDNFNVSLGTNSTAVGVKTELGWVATGISNGLAGVPATLAGPVKK